MVTCPEVSQESSTFMVTLSEVSHESYRTCVHVLVHVLGAYAWSWQQRDPGRSMRRSRLWLLQEKDMRGNLRSDGLEFRG